MLPKKMLAALLAAVLLSVPARAAEPEDAVRLPVLMYHEVKNGRSGKDAIQPGEFEGDLQYLRDNGYTTVTIRDLIGYVYGGAALPARPVVLSFDDGYWNNYLYVLPLLKKYGDRIVLSVIGKNADDFSLYPGKSIDYAHSTWDQLREMRDTGLVELQNHTYDLHGYTRSRIGCRQGPGESDAAYERRLTEDVERLQERMEEMVGEAPVAFAYPYGAYSSLTDDILYELGFRATLTCDFGMNLLTRDPDCLFRLRRICRSHGASLEKLLAQAEQALTRAGAGK